MQEDGSDRVLVVDGGGSIRRALMGDMLAAGAVKMGWQVCVEDIPTLFMLLCEISIKLHRTPEKLMSILHIWNQ